MTRGAGCSEDEPNTLSLYELSLANYTCRMEWILLMLRNIHGQISFLQKYKSINCEPPGPAA